MVGVKKSSNKQSQFTYTSETETSEISCSSKDDKEEGQPEIALAKPLVPSNQEALIHGYLNFKPKICCLSLPTVW